MTLYNQSNTKIWRKLTHSRSWKWINKPPYSI